MRGVPLRMEIGPKDLEKSQVVLARRDTRENSFVPMEGLAEKVVQDCRPRFRTRSSRGPWRFARSTPVTDRYDEFKAIMEGRPGFVVSPWCGSAACETAIKNETQATIRNIPFDSAPATGKPCIKCGEAATAHAWFAKAY